MAKAVRADGLDAAREALERAIGERPAGKRPPKTLPEKVRRLRPEIARLKSRGASWDEVTETLRPIVGASKSTIMAAMRPKPRAKRPDALEKRLDAVPDAGTPLTPAERRKVKEAQRQFADGDFVLDGAVRATSEAK